MEEIKRKDRYMENNTTRLKGQRCNLIDRSKVELSGVKTVISFDTNEVILDTVLGGLLMKGSQLNINQLDLDKGNVFVEGKIDALIYSNKNTQEVSAKKIISRLFG